MLRTQRHGLAVVLLVASCVIGASAQDVSAPATPAEPSLFAVEIKVGKTWDPARPPQEQAYFREHSANLHRMREAGILVVGARYSDIGLIVVSAATAAEVRAQMDQDPSIAAGTFVYEVHPLNVFYPGELQARTRR
jgi:uncharacterized protein YciI